MFSLKSLKVCLDLKIEIKKSYDFLWFFLFIFFFKNILLKYIFLVSFLDIIYFIVLNSIIFLKDNMYYKI